MDREDSVQGTADYIESWNFEEAPDHGGTTVKKGMKRKMQSLYYDWFHGDDGADLDAGIHEEGEVYVEGL